ALLERKWPQKYNAVGHLAWMGRMYARGLTRTLGVHTSRIYHGVWGSAPFQSLYQPAPSLVASLPLMPEWYLVTAALALVSLLGIVWTPLLASAVLLAMAVGASVAQAAASAARASFPTPARSVWQGARRRGLTALLHLLQPLARLTGRLENGLSPWRTRGPRTLAIPRAHRAALWSERWQAPVAWLQAFETALADMGARV